MSQGKQIYYHILRENIRKMHPRFKELAIEAGAYEDDGTILTGPMDTAKFAELIVQECSTLCEEVAIDADQVAKGDFVTDDGRMLHEGMWGGAKNCSGRIKQHFGIK